MGNKNNKLCALPFTQLYIQTSGDIVPCCWLPQYKLGNIKDTKLIDLWNSDRMQSLREEFLSANISICAQNIEQTRCNFLHSDLDPYVKKSKVISYPIRVEIHIGGKCNLRCIMCDEWKLPQSIIFDSHIWQSSIEEVIPYFKEIEIIGGEPFIQKETFSLIKKVSQHNKVCRFSITTNGNFKMTNRLRDKLDHANIYSISISIDSLLPDIYKKIRQGGELSKALQTLDDLILYNEERANKYILTLNTVIQKDNYKELCSLAKFAQDKKLRFYPFLMTGPHELSLYDWDESKRVSIIKDYLDCNQKLCDFKVSLIIGDLINSLSEVNKKQFKKQYMSNLLISFK